MVRFSYVNEDTKDEEKEKKTWVIDRRLNAGAQRQARTQSQDHATTMT
jgi:hypothetical protein